MKDKEERKQRKIIIRVIYVAEPENKLSKVINTIQVKMKMHKT